MRNCEATLFSPEVREEYLLRIRSLEDAGYHSSACPESLSPPSNVHCSVPQNFGPFGAY
jgi:hypothetical protein